MQEIVIKLTDDMYQAVKDGTWCGNELWWNALKNGTPLPKGHGKLIDSNILKRHIDKLPCLPDGNFAGNHSALKALINMQPTIVEADKAESEDREGINKSIENLKKLKSFHNGSYGADIDKAIKALDEMPYMFTKEETNGD